MAFDPDAYLADSEEQTPKSSGFDPDAYLGIKPDKAAPAPEISDELNLAKSTAGNVPTAAASALGFGVGMKAALPAAAMAGTAFPPAAPVVVPAVTILGGLVGAMAAGSAMDSAVDSIFKMFNPEGFAARQQEKAAHPKTTMLGEVLSSFSVTSPRTIKGVAGLLGNPLVQRGTSGILQGGISAGTDVLQGQDFDLDKTAAQTAAGFVAPSFNKLGQKAFDTGQSITRNLAPKWAGGGPAPVAKPAEPVKPDVPVGEKPVTEASSENKFLAELEKRHEETLAKTESVTTPPLPDVPSNVDGSAPPKTEREIALAKRWAAIENPVLREQAEKFSKQDPAISEVKTAAELGDYLLKTLGPDNYASKILESLLPHLPNGDKLPSSVLEPESYDLLWKNLGGERKSQGFFLEKDGDGNFVGIRMRKGYGDNPIVAAHELGHAILLEKIDAIQALPDTHPQKYKLLMMVEDVSALMSRVQVEMGNKVAPEVKTLFEYALTNPHEFISEGLFNPAVSDVLLKVEITNRGFLSKLVSNIGKFLGMDPKKYTAFHELIEVSQKLAAAEHPRMPEKVNKGIVNEKQPGARENTHEIWAGRNKQASQNNILTRIPTWSKEKLEKFILSHEYRMNDPKNEPFLSEMMEEVADAKAQLISRLPKKPQGALSEEDLRKAIEAKLPVRTPNAYNRDKRDAGQARKDAHTLREAGYKETSDGVWKHPSMPQGPSIRENFKAYPTAADKTPTVAETRGTVVGKFSRKADLPEIPHWERMQQERANISKEKAQKELGILKTKREGKSVEETRRIDEQIREQEEILDKADKSLKSLHQLHLTRFPHLAKIEQEAALRKQAAPATPEAPVISNKGEESVVPKGSLLEGDPEVVTAAKGIDLRTIASPAEFMKHAEGIYAAEGKEAALKFFKDWTDHQNKVAIGLPKSLSELADVFHKVRTYMSADMAELRMQYEMNTYGRKLTFGERFKASSEMKATQELMNRVREKMFMEREGVVTHYTPEEQVKVEALRKAVLLRDEEIKALIIKARKLMGDDTAFRDLESGQARYLIPPKGKDAWTKFWDNNTPMGDKVGEQATATMARSLFQLEDGRVVQVKQLKGDDVQFLIEWKINKDGKPYPSYWEGKTPEGIPDGSGMKKMLAKSAPGEKLQAGSIVKVDGKMLKMVDGKVQDIERLSPYRYIKDVEATQNMKLLELRAMTRDMELVAGLKETNFLGAGRPPTAKDTEVPHTFKQPNNIDSIPQLRGWSFEPKIAAVIEDFAKVWKNDMYMKLTSFVIKNMMLNPFPHMMNEVAHLYNLRGLSGWVTPKGLARFAVSGNKAFYDVATQSAFYREIMREGGSMLGADPRNSTYYNELGVKPAKEMDADPAMAKTLAGVAKKLKDVGIDPVVVGALSFYNAWSKNSQKAMWFTRDVMYVQAVHEVMALSEKRGHKMTLKEAVDRVELHMPNYRIPTEVLGSRELSKVLQNPKVAVFSRYHYGMTRSILNTITHMNPKNLKTPEGRQEFKDGVDTLLAMVVAMTMLYPLLDVVAEQIFGKNAHMRRAGPFHLIHAGVEVASQKKDMSALIWPVFTFNPVLLTMGQLAVNKQLFSGKPIYHPEDPLADKAGDVGYYLAKSIPQVQTGLKGQGDGSWTSAVAKQVDVQVRNPKQQTKAEESEKFRDRNAITRAKERLKGTYVR